MEKKVKWIKQSCIFFPPPPPRQNLAKAKYFNDLDVMYLVKTAHCSVHTQLSLQPEQHPTLCHYINSDFQKSSFKFQ